VRFCLIPVCCCSLWCEIAVHLLQSVLDCDDAAVLSVDIETAFNSVDRAAVLRALYSHDALSPLFKLTDWAYSSPSLLLVRNRAGKVIEVLESECGVRQGDPLGLLLFCLALMSALC
jgi:hypothetical protein